MMGFGRKGLAAGDVAASPAAFGNAPAFGGEPQSSEDDLAAKRQAFIASERARKRKGAQPTSFSPADSKAPRSTAFDHLRGDARPASPLASRFQDTPPHSPPSSPPARARKTSVFGKPEKRHVALAYFCWFILGQMSLHRFYCGDTKGGIAQVLTFAIALAGMMAGSVIGIAGFGIWALWIFADLFLIPGLLRKFQREHRDMSSSVFA